MTEDIVSYPQAVALKEVGYNWTCRDGYSVKFRLEPVPSFGEVKSVHSKDPKNYNDSRKGIADGLNFCSAPTLAMTAKWFREVKGLAINVLAHDGGKYDYEIVFLPNADDNYELYDRSTWSKTFEEALSEGISAALKVLEKAYAK